MTLDTQDSFFGQNPQANSFDILTMATVPVPSFAPVTVAPAFVPTFSTSAPVAPTGGNLSVPTFLLNPTAAAPSLAADGFPPGELSRQIVESWDGEFCPLGYLCQDVRRVNCTVLRGVVLAYQFGDLLAGMHCPAGRPGYLNCERGSYCPDPVRTIKKTTDCVSYPFNSRSAAPFTRKPSFLAHLECFVPTR